MSKRDRRQEILQAAGRVVLAQGVGAFTLEAVAAAAGVSKGGLLYHFATKEELLSGMVDQLIEMTEARIERAMAGDRGAGRWTRGYLAACAVDPSGQDPLDRLATALLAAGATDPGLLDRLREHETAWSDLSRADGLDTTTAAVVRLAADGLWMNDLFGIEVLSAKERKAVLKRLGEMTQSEMTGGESGRP
jgi:AcrR family transcriptional regulator